MPRGTKPESPFVPVEDDWVRIDASAHAPRAVRDRLNSEGIVFRWVSMHVIATPPKNHERVASVLRRMSLAGLH